MQRKGTINNYYIEHIYLMKTAPSQERSAGRVRCSSKFPIFVRCKEKSPGLILFGLNNENLLSLQKV